MGDIIKGFIGKVWSVSGSKVVTIPKKIVKEMKIKEGDYVRVIIAKVKIEPSPSDVVVSYKE